MISFNSYITIPLNKLFYFDQKSNQHHMCEELYADNKKKKERYQIVIINPADVEDADLDEDCIAYLSIEDRNDLNNSKQATRFASIYCHAIEQHIF